MKHPSFSTAMPLPTAAAPRSDPDSTVGPRKHCPTQHVTENADLLACKRAKQMPKVTGIKDIGKPVPPPPTQPCNYRQVLEAANSDSSDNNKSSDTPEQEVNRVDDTNKERASSSPDDDAELGEQYTILLNQILIPLFSSSLQRLGCTYLHIFQAPPCHCVFSSSESTCV